MESEKHSEMLSNLELDIVKKGFEWLSAQQIHSVKELSSTVSAHALWRLPNPYITRLILKQERWFLEFFNQGYCKGLLSPFN